MDLKEKKKREKNYQERRTQSIPTDITIEILSRLPEKSIARFSCVSKLWLSITTDPSFPRPRLLLCFQKDEDLYVSSIPQHTHNSNMSYSSSLSFEHHHKIKLPTIYNRFSSKDSVHGLICFHKSGNPEVWNPSTRQSITLPPIPTPCKDWNKTTLLLGYDPIERKHKVVCLPFKRRCYVCRVFTLGSGQESWRTVKANHQHRPISESRGRCIEGVIYYIAKDREFGYGLMSFDVRSEKFNMIKLPPRSFGGMLITYKGRLAFFSRIDIRMNDRRLWILEDAQRHIWSGQDCLSPFYDFDSVTSPFKLTGFTHAGEFIYVPKRVSHSFYILLRDPVRDSWRRFEFKGMADEVYALHAFPNHIDSQISL